MLKLSRVVWRAALVLAGAAGCSNWASEGAGAAGQAASLAVLSSDESARAVVAARYRLPPDRRFLLAAADVSRLLGGSGAAVSASFEGGQWRLRQGSLDVGSLPELPAYPDGARMLDAWGAAQAVALASAPRALPPALESLPPVGEAFRLARAAGVRFDSCERALGLREGAHALAALAFQVPDPMGQRGSGTPRSCVSWKLRELIERLTRSERFENS